MVSSWAVLNSVWQTTIRVANIILNVVLPMHNLVWLYLVLNCLVVCGLGLALPGLNS